MFRFFHFITGTEALIKVIILSLLNCTFYKVHSLRNDNPDEIFQLPGLGFKINFKHYAGYLNATQDNFLFYWFIESQRSPAEDPIVLWLNGGPGCSSLDGLLTEIGPFRANNRNALDSNPYSWNKAANILFLETPAGVGFTLTKNFTGISDDDVSLENYLALQHFFLKFPEYRKNAFYVTGESYAGVYVPTLCIRLITGKFRVNLKGLVIGNGALDRSLMTQSVIFYSYFHGLLGFQTWENLTKACCKGTATRKNCKVFGEVTVTCFDYVDQALTFIYSPELNHYNIYEDCYHDPENTSRYSHDKQSIKHLSPTHPINRPKFMAASSAPCTNDAETTAYLNQESVRKALHVSPNAQNWVSCNQDIFKSFNKTYMSMKEQILKLVKSGQRVLIYNGDVDTVCNFLGDEWFVEALNLTVTKDHDVWMYEGKVAGFVKYFENLTFMTIKGSGHMVPKEMPGRALKILTNFLNSQPF